MDHRLASINLENKALVGELCRFGCEIRRITAKKSITRTNRAHAPESQLTCKLAQRTHMVVDTIVNINSMIGRPVDMVLLVTHCMAEFVRILCTLKYRSSDTYTVDPHLTHATACV